MGGLTLVDYGLALVPVLLMTGLFVWLDVFKLMSLGEIVVLISPNAAGMRSLRLLKGKSVTPYMTGKPSSAARGLSATDPVIAVRIAEDVAIGYPGSVPIYVGPDMIGTITVAGAQNNTDEACASAGLAKVQARLK